MGASCIDEYDGWRLHFHGGFPQCGADRRGGVLADDCGKKVQHSHKGGMRMHSKRNLYAVVFIPACVNAYMYSFSGGDKICTEFLWKVW